MDERRAQPWHSTAGMLHGPQWSAADIMDKTYHAARLLPRNQRSKEAFYKYLNKSKKTFNDYLAAVGMQWEKGYGPPGEDHLVLVISADTRLIEWVSDSVCRAVRKDQHELVGHLPSQVLRGGLVLDHKVAEFTRILAMLRAGNLNVGQMSTYILASDGSELPLRLDITYGHGLNVLFINGVIDRANDQPELFNVEPGIIPREFALLRPQPTVTREAGKNRVPLEWDSSTDVKALMERYLLTYRFPSDVAD